MLACRSDPLKCFFIFKYNLPDRRQVNGITHHMRVTMDILNSEIELVKDYRTFMKEDKSTCLYQDRFSCLQRCRKEMLFLQGYQIESVRKVMD